MAPSPTAPLLSATLPALCLTAAALGCLCPTAAAQWTAIRLHDLSDYSSVILAGEAGVFGGYRQTTLNGPQIPGYWSGPNYGWTGLGTGSALDIGQVNALSGDMQGGRLNQRATLWHGTAQSVTYLQDVGSSYIGTSVAAMAGGEQVGNGYYMNSNNARALLWHGTASSLVDLNPPGALDSQVNATDGMHQGGAARFPGTGGHAGVWSGNAASFLDLAPPSADFSGINGMAAGQLVGSFDAAGPTPMHAALWPSLAPSVIDMHPFPGSTGSSDLLATNGLAQVGWSHVPGFSLPHAGIWFGTPESFVDLSAFLPPGYSSSVANSITWADGVFTIGGVASRTGNSGGAFLWVGVPAPSSVTLLAAAALLAPRRRR